ncbi:ferritin light chain-like [Ctenodactylus gundi]
MWLWLKHFLRYFRSSATFQPPSNAFPDTLWRDAQDHLPNRPAPFRAAPAPRRPAMSSRRGQNYPPDVATAISGLVRLLLHASHTYLSLSFFLARVDAALGGAGHFFRDLAEEKRQGAQRLLRMHTQRGGSSSGLFGTTQVPAPWDWGAALTAMGAALALEEDVNRALAELQALDSMRTDPHLGDFLEYHFLEEEAMLLRTVGCHLTQLRRLAGPWAGLLDCLLARLCLRRYLRSLDTSML